MWSSQRLGKSKNPEASPLRRIFSYSGGISRDPTSDSLGLEPLNMVREREAEFYEFMDHELDKVETFYKLKEQQAGDRLSLLKEQLHEMRNRRIQEMIDENIPPSSGQKSYGSISGAPEHGKGWVMPLKGKIFPPGPNSKGFRNMQQTPKIAAGESSSNEERRDYIRRPEQHDVSYRTAKRKLKLALQEFYRGLELLKSYSLLNRTAFRKINKKFDKAANARPPLRYVNEKVNHAWFVNSDVLDGHIKAVEDLYARYFEKGNHKVAAGKLRSLSKKKTDESGSSFVNGLLLGTGVVFAIQGVIQGHDRLYDGDPTVRLHASYLMQIYGGYFLMLLLCGLFCVNCWAWTTNKVNYPFIFEFDQRSHIDWRRLSAFPSFFLLLMGVFMWVNFSEYGSGNLFLYWPVFLIGLSAVIILLPLPWVLHKSRFWFAYSHWRLLLAGLYPVEFRDFFMGDMYCSLTYSMANIELFFCLYANDWQNPSQCNSNHSRLLGFFTALPAVWRAFQCIRRFKDTGNVFPHLVNCGKYMMTIASYVALSSYRIQRSNSNLALYITFALLNAIYCSIWDLFMDFSLMQFHSRNKGLRDILAFNRKWVYYSIMVIDPLLRFNWIFYAIFTYDTQHSTIASFFVSLAEVIRRGIWALVRVENEHCANVSQYKASRDVPLPYRIEPLIDHRSSTESSPDIPAQEGSPEDARPTPARQSTVRWDGGISTATSTAVGNSVGSFRRRAGSSSAVTFSKLLAEAHKQDFEKRRKPEEVAQEDERRALNSDFEDEDEDDDYDAVDSLDVAEAARLSRHGQDHPDAV